MPTPQEYLSTYLKDHLVTAVGELELAERCRDENKGNRWGAAIEEMLPVLRDDRQTARQLLEELGGSEPKVRQAAAWLLEKVGRLKPNQQLTGYSPLSRVVELEALLLANAMRANLWSALNECCGKDPQWSQHGFVARRDRAANHRVELFDLYLQAAREAFASDEPTPPSR